MKKICTCLALLATLTLHAQHYYFPLPPSPADYKTIEAAGVKICYEYRLENGVKTLNTVLEYGNKGLPAVYMEKGTDDNGDSVTISETIYKYTPGLSLQLSSTSGEEESRTLYTYNTAGRLVQKEIASFDPYIYKYAYNAKGQLASVKAFARIPTMDENGDPDGKYADKPQLLYKYKYDSKNRLSEELYIPLYESENNTQVTAAIKWEYNTLNQVTRISFMDEAEGMRSNRVTFDLKYNKQGLLQQLIRTAGSEDPEEYVYEYCTDCKQSWMQ